MRVLLTFLIVVLTFSISSSAQEKKINMWFNGDQDKPMPVILLAVDTSVLKKDTIATYKYLINQMEYAEIRSIFLKENIAVDSNYSSSYLNSFDFTIIGAESYLVFFTKKVGLLEMRFNRILEALKLNPQYDALKRDFKNILSRISALKAFPR
jgi:hypothetical protein